MWGHLFKWGPAIFRLMSLAQKLKKPGPEKLKEVLSGLEDDLEAVEMGTGEFIREEYVREAVEEFISASKKLAKALQKAEEKKNVQ